MTATDAIGLALLLRQESDRLAKVRDEVRREAERLEAAIKRAEALAA